MAFQNQRIASGQQDHPCMISSCGFLISCAAQGVDFEEQRDGKRKDEMQRKEEGRGERGKGGTEGEIGDGSKRA